MELKVPERYPTYGVSRTASPKLSRDIYFALCPAFFKDIPHGSQCPHKVWLTSDENYSRSSDLKFPVLYDPVLI